MRVKLVFYDWHSAVGKSIYRTEKGVELSMGDLHSGSTFGASVEFSSDTADEVAEAFAAGYLPVFYAIPDVQEAAE